MIKSAQMVAMRRELTKLAVVPGWKKQYRRALEALVDKSHAYHGTNRGKSIARSGAVVPGTTNVHGRGAVPDSYWGDKLPDIYYTANDTVVAVPRERVLSAKGRAISKAKVSVHKNDAGNAEEWLAASKDVPIKSKDLYVPGLYSKKDDIKAAQISKMRVVGRKAFWDAHAKATKSGLMAEELRRRPQNYLSLKKQMASMKNSAELGKK